VQAAAASYLHISLPQLRINTTSSGTDTTCCCSRLYTLLLLLLIAVFRVHALPQSVPSSTLLYIATAAVATARPSNCH
jgi:hypothetical protein